jgi:hypothetical protein
MPIDPFDSVWRCRKEPRTIPNARAVLQGPCDRGVLECVRRDAIQPCGRGSFWKRALYVTDARALIFDCPHGPVFAPPAKVSGAFLWSVHVLHDVT